MYVLQTPGHDESRRPHSDGNDWVEFVPQQIRPQSQPSAIVGAFAMATVACLGAGLLASLDHEAAAPSELPADRAAVASTSIDPLLAPNIVQFRLDEHRVTSDPLLAPNLVQFRLDEHVPR